VNIKLDSILFNDNKEKLYAGIMMRQDTFGIYSTFFNKKASVMDLEMISSDYSLSYNKRISAFIINGKDSLDNVYTFYEKTCKTSGQGKIDLTLDLGRVDVNMVGMINNDMQNNKTDLKGFILVNFFFSKQAMLAMATEFNKDNIHSLEYNDFYVSNLRRVVLDKDKASIFRGELETNKITITPDELNVTLAFTDINMKWDNKSKIFISKGDIGLGNIYNNQILDIVDGGEIIFEKRSSNNGDGMLMHLKSFGDESYYFRFLGIQMRSFSWDPSFHDAIESMDVSKRRQEGSPKYNYLFHGNTKETRCKWFEKEVKKAKKKY